jgi:serine/threonine protein kinase
LSESDEISTRIYDRGDDLFRIIVKSINMSGCIDEYDVVRRVENLMNLRHPCIAGAIGVVLLSRLQRLKIVRKYLCGHSLSEIVSTSPEWWTPTAKAKAVVSLVLGLRFSHSLGLLHGHLTGNNVYLKEDGMIQMTDFCLNGLRQLERNPTAKVDVGGFSGESWTPKVDVRAFAGLLSEIVIGTSGEQGGYVPSVPSFVLKMIERGQSADLKSIESFSDILTTLKQNDFTIMEGVDVAEVSNFVSWLEWSEMLIE